MECAVDPTSAITRSIGDGWLLPPVAITPDRPYHLRTAEETLPMLAAIAAPVTGSGVAPPQMHAPDGFLSVPVALAMWAVTIVVLAIAVRRTNETLDEKAVPLLGVMAAFIFAAQMFNFQVVGGTSGHLLGGVLAAVLLGPWAATLVMACVVGVQALVFQDGGLLVMGANIFNMGIVGTLGGFYLYRALAALFGGEDRARIPAAGIAAWASVAAGATCMAVELAVSGTTPLALALPAMVGVHALIGIGEALITMAALAFISVTRSDLFWAARRPADRVVEEPAS
jgi:cobalt/nickel transport system permease protein